MVRNLVAIDSPFHSRFQEILVKCTKDGPEFRCIAGLGLSHSNLIRL